MPKGVTRNRSDGGSRSRRLFVGERYVMGELARLSAAQSIQYCSCFYLVDSRQDCFQMEYSYPCHSRCYRPSVPARGDFTVRRPQGQTTSNSSCDRRPHLHCIKSGGSLGYILWCPRDRQWTGRNRREKKVIGSFRTRSVLLCIYWKFIG